MDLRHRFVIAQPTGTPNTLARAAADAGAYAMIDATRPDWQAQAAAVPRERLVLRVDVDAAPTSEAALAVIAPWTLDAADVGPLRTAIGAWHAAGLAVAVEVRDRQEARRARDAGADMLVARGAEGPGRVSTRSNLVLLPALKSFGLPLIAWGGAGPNATAALLVHADMVVLDAQLHMLPEAGVSDAWRDALRTFDGTDVRTLGTGNGTPFNVHARVADKAVHALWEQELAGTVTPAELRARIDDAPSPWTLGPGQALTPIGPDAAHASAFAGHGTLAALLSWLEDRIAQQFGTFPLVEGSELAQAHRTRLPVVQGAMANVSEVPAFARAVADAGALPFLAFAALRENYAEEVLQGTIDVLDDDQSFGVGIIGLDVNAAKRDAHVSLIKQHRPPIALVAAGTAEQATDLQRAGVDTYLHTPSPGIVRQAVDAGIRRVVLEGAECGGHIGKLPSLVLWDLCLQQIDTGAGTDDPVQVLLAGGVSNEDTAAMAGVLAAATPRAQPGVLMGTAYLGTREIVETGAITPEYQRLVLAARDTAVTGESVGIRARSAPTPFTERIVGLERELVREGRDIRQRKEVLEHENLGATRIAARGLKRGDDGTYHEIPPEERLQDGNYLMGQAAELFEDTQSLDELHARVTTGAEATSRDAAARLGQRFEPRTGHAATDQSDPTDAIAVVGLGCVLPDAPDVATFWQNLLDARVSIREIPEDRWPVATAAHLRPDETDGTYTLLGAFVDDDAFDPIRYRIPPAVAAQMDGSQRWAVSAVDQALADAGLDDVEDRARWGVILGNALGGEQRVWTDRRLALREAITELRGANADQDAIAHLEAMLERLPPITEDTMPGELSNVIAGRVCHAFDIGGPARTVDAACASSLAAVEEAVHMLRNGTIDVAVTGGVDRSMDPSAYSKFSAIGALSRDGSFPFDDRASGFVMGEGCAILVLKRLADAERDGDRIYAVVEGVGSSSDGRGKGITAPNPAGQERAIRNALADAGWDAATIELVEAHGTGTPVGDPAEAATLEAVLSGAQPGSVALGSVKGNIGHLKAAAGAAGLLKATLAIHHATVPPTVIGTPSSKIDWERSPLRPATAPTPWQSASRRTGVSAFGFGGTNSHILLAAPPRAAADASPREDEDTTTVDVRLLTGADRQTVAAALDDPDAAASNVADAVRLALAPDADPDAARQVLGGELPAELALGRGIALSEGPPGKLAFVFPGQGSQYAGMVLDLADEHPVVAETLAEADAVLTPLLGRPLSELLGLEGEEGQAALTRTEVCQPAVLTCDVAILRLLEERGVRPDVVAGHSLGEYAALVAGGVLSFGDALKAVSARGREMANVHVEDPGGLVAIAGSATDAEPLVDGLDAWPANLNAPNQTVIAGTTPAIATILERAEAAGIKASRIPVSAAFHSPIVAPAVEPLGRVLDGLPFRPPTVDVIANVTAEPYPHEADEARKLLREQVASPVQWVRTMQRLDDMGVDLVVEVGPKRVLTNLAKANDPDVAAVPTAHPRTGAKKTLGQAMLVLAAHGDLPVAPATPPSPTPARTGVPATTVTNGGAAAGAPDLGSVRTVVTGVAVGAPGQADPFADDTTASLLAGTNRISRVSEAAKATMANMGITRLVKDDASGPRLEPIASTDDVIQLAARIEAPDLRDYGVDEDWAQSADVTAKLAIAAALNALTDAHIPLVRERRTTSTGTVIEEGWVLPDDLQDDTGVILASAFPGYDSLVREVQARAAAGAAPTDDIIDAVMRLAPHIPSKEGRAALLDWVTSAHAGGHATDAPADADPFPRDFLFRALGMGHAQVAQILRARGPNLHVNAACASTTAALALAQDWLRAGRCRRVIVVGADVAGSDALVPWVGAGFMSAGAATTAANVEEAALPFDRRRHGMLIGSGAVAFVIERAEDAAERGVEPLAELTATHVANSAYHGARLDPDHVAREAASFVRAAGEQLGMNADAIARELVFVSHEPATPARGGSAQAEVNALRAALGEHAGDVLVTNTKGLTGHAMGAGIEDAMAVRILQHRRAPPVANLREIDPEFEDIQFSRGDATDRGLALRFAAGFGSQLALALFRRTSDAPGAIDGGRHAAWLARHVGDGARVEVQKRLLRAIDDGTPEPVAATVAATNGRAADETPAPRAAPVEATAEVAPTGQATGAIGTSVDDIADVLTRLVAERTGYPIDVIEPEMDLEGDLGVDTVKQAEVLAAARTELGVPPIEGMSLADVPTIASAAALLAQHLGGGDAPEAPQPTPEATPANDAAAQPDFAPTDDVQALLTRLVAERTGYPEDVIEPEMDLEGDLGVDTVKQAEVLAAARQALDIPPIEGMSLADVPTIARAAALLSEHLGGGVPPAPTAEGTADEGEAQTPAEDAPVDEDTPMPTLALTWRPADAAPVEVRSVAMIGDDADHAGLVQGLDRHGASIVDAADAGVIVVPVEADTPDDLVDLLVALQDTPASTPRVLVVDAGHWAAAGIHALARTLTHEQRPTRAVLVDDATPDQLADEVLRGTDHTVRLGQHARWSPALAAAPPATGETPPADATIVATGGLGAAVWPCLEAIARGRNTRIVAVGRGDADDPGIDPDDAEAVDALRTRLFTEMRDEPDTTPADVQRRIDATIKQARRARALDALRRHAEVRYVRCDATDATALDAALDEGLDGWGEPDLVVHGAGMERSRPFADKARDEMAAVLGAKLAPVLALVDRFPDAHHVAFGSVAGVTGNAMQADYALANGSLTGAMGAVGGTVIHWTAWEAAGGMADDDTIRAVLDERGVRYLDVDEGAAIFADRCMEPGAWCVADLDPDTPTAPTPDGARVTLSGDETWLTDHAVGGRPIVPGVRHLQAMTEAALPVRGPTRAVSAVRFHKGLWVTEPTDALVELDGADARVVSDGRLFAQARLDRTEGVKPLEPVEAPTEGWGRDDVYQHLFHGPSFQVLELVDASPDRVVAVADLSVGGAAPWALAVEACMQCAGLGELAAEADLGLPAGIEEIEIDPAAATPRAVVHAQLVARDLVGTVWDATVRAPDGDVVAVARGIRLNGMGSSTRLMDAVQPLEVASGLPIAIARVPPHEPRDPRAKREAERAAGNEAAARVLQRVHGRDVPVERDDDGRPHPVDAPGGVSITHGHGVALAAASDEHDGIGIDLERIEERADAWLEDNFTDDERELIGAHEGGVDVAATLMWTMKEAASKAVGTGLTVPAKELRVGEIGQDGRARVATADGDVEVWTALGDGYVVAVARR